MEDHDLVDPVQEFRPEMGLQNARHLVTCDSVAALPQLVAQVGSHDHDRVAEVHRAPLAIRQAPIVQKLQQNIEDFRVRFLDLIEQQHAVGAAAHRFGQLAALVVAHVSGWGADQARDGMFLLVLAHIDADHGALIVEQVACQGARQLGLAHSGGSQEDKGADRPVGVLQPGPGASHRVRNHPHRLVLPDHALVQGFFHMQQFLRLALQQARNRDAGPACHHRRDLFRVHFLFEQGALGLNRLEMFFSFGQFSFQLAQRAVAQAGGLLQV